MDFIIGAKSDLGYVNLGEIKIVFYFNIQQKSLSKF
jgi:hypothetical protein